MTIRPCATGTFGLFAVFICLSHPPYRRAPLRFVLIVAALLFAIPAYAPLGAQGVQQTKGSFEDKFRQLDEVLPDPSTTRNASGAPGHEYWQQKVDYKITATLDETKRRLTAKATIRYTNN